MRILYYYGQTEKLMSKWQQHHFFNELAMNGIIVDLFNPLDYPTIKASNEALIDYLKNNDIDLFMTPYNEDMLYISSLKMINKLSIPSLLICYDNLVIPYHHKNICKFFDLVWLTSYETEGLFKKWGAKSVFLPYAANPYVFKPKTNNEVSKVCFIGTPYGSRVNMLNDLTSSSVSVDLFSNACKQGTIANVEEKTSNISSAFINLSKFKYGRRVLLGAIKNKLLNSHTIDNDSNFISFKPPVPVENLGEMYSKYALSLSSTAARNTGSLKNPLHIVNLRSFEIPMSGGIQFCQYNKELASYYMDEKEIIFYNNKNDMIDKAHYYLSDERKALRDEIKRSARLRSEKDHCWMARFQVLFNELGLE